MNRLEDQIRWLFWLVITAFLVYLCWRMLQPFVNILLSATVLVIVFLPLHQFLLKRVKNASLCSLLTMGIIILIVIAPLAALTAQAVAEAASLAANLQNLLAGLQGKIAEGSQYHQYWMTLKNWLNLDMVVNSDTLKKLLGDSAEFMMKNTVNILGGAIGMVASVLLVLFTMYYLFRDHQSIYRLLPTLLPLEPDRSQALLIKIREVINASIYGALTIASIQGFLGGILFWALGIPSAIVWGVLMSFLSLIPLVGSALIWLPASLILFFTGHWIKGLILILCAVIIISNVDNVLRPRLVGKKTQMHELLIFFSVMGGVKLFGMLGILFGPLVLSVAMGFLEVAWLEEARRESSGG